MSTFQEIGRDYASRVSAAIRQDGMLLTTPLSTASLRSAHVVTVLREIGRELETKRTIDDRPLTDREKQEIARAAGVAFGLEQPDVFYLAVRAASNDAYVDLVGLISNIIGKKR